MIIMIVILTIVMIFFCMVSLRLEVDVDEELWMLDGNIKVLRKRLFVQKVQNDFKVPVYKALEKRWNHWDDLENDPRYL